MKKIKSTEERPLKSVVSDFDKIYRERVEAKKKADREARQKEKDRIDNIKCPSCQSTSKNHVVKRADNGIFGPGFASWVTDEYFVCKECGTMYKDMKK